MTHTYNISGMTCNNCVAKVKSELLKIGDITAADVDLTNQRATITMQKHIPIDTLQSAVKKTGNYTITEGARETQYAMRDEETRPWLDIYKPILLIFFYMSVIAFIAAKSENGFDFTVAMRVFMSGFFLAFSFFKFLDLKGFADSYSTYDIVAKRFIAWGFIYPFVEFLLGIAYAINFNPFVTNATTFVVMTVSVIGVLQSVLNKRKIQCACLGAVFNLPMSTVTIFEDVLMIAMSGMMLITLAS